MMAAFESVAVDELAVSEGSSGVAQKCGPRAGSNLVYKLPLPESDAGRKARTAFVNILATHGETLFTRGTAGTAWKSATEDLVLSDAADVVHDLPESILVETRWGEYEYSACAAQFSCSSKMLPSLKS